MADLGEPSSRNAKTSLWPLSPAEKAGGLDGASVSAASGQSHQRGGDHSVSHRRGISQKSYPPDCPPLAVQWFFAVDIPKRKPDPAGGKPRQSTAGPPKKYAAFSNKDSRAIEMAFKAFAKDSEVAARRRQGIIEKAKPEDSSDLGRGAIGSGQNALEDASKVPVNEDGLFDVDIEQRELGPAYWLGPVYDVRRGTWFQTDGTPVEENLATQLEEGYLQLAPWRFPQPKATVKARPRSALGFGESRDIPASPLTTKASSPALRPDDKTSELPKQEKAPESTKTNTQRLFGPYSNSIVTYQDAVTAWMTTDDFLSRVSGSVYQRFAGGSHLAGVKFTRGYLDPSKGTETKQKPDAASSESQDTSDNVKASLGKKRSRPDVESESGEDQPESKSETIARHLSSMVTASSTDNIEDHEEEARKRDEQEIRNDYANRENEEQNRALDHLILVTHGIGQRLGLRLETVNFIHDVTTFRKTLKSVYEHSADLQALNSEIDSLSKNCRIQVLPINWRHRLDFPKQSLKHNRGEHDIADAGTGEEEDYPSLDDITVDGVPAVRNLITDLALDILLYDSPAYKDHIARIVVEECNKTYRLFCKREPSFHGKISFVGHSLGSAIMFDILCRQGNNSTSKMAQQFALDFEVEHFYAIGSPIGLFQMLKGRTIAAREPPVAPGKAKGSNIMANLFDNDTSTATNTDIPLSSPKCSQLFNIFHPADPISYRLEPLISPAMKALKPQLLPYTKRSLFSVPGQGLTNIGTRVGQSVSGLWSSFSTGIASSLLNRSLGISGDDELKLRHSSAPVQPSLGAGTNIAAGTIDAHPIKAVDDEQKAAIARAAASTVEGQDPPILLDSEIETLYAGFKKTQDDDGVYDRAADRREAEERAKKLKKEEAKVRALNANGRVDYSIQEGAFDISLIAAVASHLSYWSDEDCAHFMISQLLSRHRVVKPPDTS